MSKEAYVKAPMRVVDHPDSDGLFVRFVLNRHNIVVSSESYEVSGNWAVCLSGTTREALLVDDLKDSTSHVVWLHVPSGVAQDVNGIFRNRSAEGIFEIGPEGEEEQFKNTEV